ncbi:DUF1492 domain-containing protein [Caldanaerobacter sp.]|uniref:DUF1492 domain-containing protein n=1 Tax=Caldanaerobacter sp. TaxID=2930036 RepID=UPI003C7472D3
MELMQMAVLDREIYKEIEKMLYKYFELKRMYKEKREEIMFGQKNNIKANIKNIGYYSDPTSTTAIRLLSKELETIENWIKVIEKTREKFADTDKGKLLEMQYFEELGPEHIQSKLHIERRTYYMWRNDIVLFTALLAQKYGLIDVEKEEVKVV